MINIYLVILNLSNSEDNYVNLLPYMKSFSVWARPMNNVWIVQTYMNAAVVRDAIASKVGNTDKVLVIEVKPKNWASLNINKEVAQWMKDNF